jgi:hypothetical protein
VAGQIYGRLVSEGAFETMDRRDKFRKVSEKWHRLLRFKSAVDGAGQLRPGHKRKRRSLFEEASKRAQVARWKMLGQVDMDRQLRLMYGELA